MGKPKHRRCSACGVVTSRYSHTQVSGPFAIKVWTRDARNGEQVDRGTGRIYCDIHAVQTPPPPVPPLPLPPITGDDLLARAATDKSLDDDTFAVLSRAFRGVDPIDGEVPA